MEVRYEDVLRNHRATFARVIGFLKINDPEDRLLDFVTERIKDDLRPETAGKWSKELTARECRVFEAVAATCSTPSTTR